MGNWFCNCFAKQAPKRFDLKREVDIADREVNEVTYPTNFISTTKYSVFSFLPVCLLIQFTKSANCYFLLSAILNSIDLISPLSPLSSIMPLVFVITLSLLREMYEDLSRHNSDLQTNAMTTTHVKKYKHMKEYNQETILEIIKWKDLLVGDLVMIKNNESIPADIVMLASSDSSGGAFIQTSSLDGEKAPKPKQSVLAFQILANNTGGFEICGKLIADPPDANLYSAHGKIFYPILDEKPIFWDEKNLLLRGATLKNTEYAIGLIVYTGLDTKIMRNGAESSHKLSNIERMVNVVILLIFGFQMTLCFVIAVGCGVWTEWYGDQYSYFIEKRFNGAVEGVLAFLSSFALTATMVPISLIICVEVVKIIQAAWIMSDEKMMLKTAEPGKQNVNVLSSSLNEELGQVNYIFSDKTGTFTANIMVFKFALIGDCLYGDKSLLDSAPKTPRKATKNFKRSKTHQDIKEDTEFDFIDKELNKILIKKEDGAEINYNIRQST